MKNNYKKIIKILLAIFLVAILIRSVDWYAVFVHIKEANVLFLGFFVLFYIIGLLISAQKWSVLGRFIGFDRPYLFYVKTYLLGTFLNNFFPSFVGGDAYRALALGRSEKRLIDSSSTIVLDRATGFIAIVALASCSGLINIDVLVDFEYILVFILALSVFVLVGIFLFFFRKSAIIQKSFSFLPQYVRKYITTIAHFSAPIIMLRSMNYSFLFSIVGIGIANYMLFLSVGATISVVDYMSVIFLSSLITALPISVGNIGTKEWAYIFLFGIFGVSASALVAIVLLSRFLQMIVSLFALPFYFHEKDRLT